MPPGGFGGIAALLDEIVACASLAAFPGSGEKIVSGHTRGMSTREIQVHPMEIHGRDDLRRVHSRLE
jgi:hypothetical protein